MAAISLTINGNTYLFPSAGDSPNWGDEVTQWAQAVSNALQAVTGNGDIVQTAAILANNQTTATNVPGLSFSTSAVRGAVIDYSIYRTTTGTGAQERIEVGTIYLSYKSIANTWEMAQVCVSGPAGVTFSITGPGQIQYTSDNQTGSSYIGTLHYRARALTQ